MPLVGAAVAVPENAQEIPAVAAANLHCHPPPRAALASVQAVAVSHQPLAYPSRCYSALQLASRPRHTELQKCVVPVKRVEAVCKTRKRSGLGHGASDLVEKQGQLADGLQSCVTVRCPAQSLPVAERMAQRFARVVKTGGLQIAVIASVCKADPRRPVVGFETCLNVETDVALRSGVAAQGAGQAVADWTGLEGKSWR